MSINSFLFVPIKSRAKSAFSQNYYPGKCALELRVESGLRWKTVWGFAVAYMRNRIFVSLKAEEEGKSVLSVVVVVSSSFRIPGVLRRASRPNGVERKRHVRPRATRRVEGLSRDSSGSSEVDCAHTYTHELCPIGWLQHLLNKIRADITSIGRLRDRSFNFRFARSRHQSNSAEQVNIKNAFFHVFLRPLLLSISSRKKRKYKYAFPRERKIIIRYFI